MHSCGRFRPTSGPNEWRVTGLAPSTARAQRPPCTATLALAEPQVEPCRGAVERLPARAISASLRRAPRDPWSRAVHEYPRPPQAAAHGAVRRHRRDHPHHRLSLASRLSRAIWPESAGARPGQSRRALRSPWLVGRTTASAPVAPHSPRGGGGGGGGAATAAVVRAAVSSTAARSHQPPGFVARRPMDVPALRGKSSTNTNPLIDCAFDPTSNGFSHRGTEDSRNPRRSLVLCDSVRLLQFGIH